MKVGRILQGDAFPIKEENKIEEVCMFLSFSKVFLWSKALSLENKEAVQESVL